MPRLTYRQEALDDLDEIAAFTLKRWGRPQSRRYIRQLRASCRRLSAFPLLGAPCDHLALGLRRTVHGSHVILYRQTAGGIRIVRILHHAMSPSQHIMRED